MKKTARVLFKNRNDENVFEIPYFYKEMYDYMIAQLVASGSANSRKYKIASDTFSHGLIKTYLDEMNDPNRLIYKVEPTELTERDKQHNVDFAVEVTQLRFQR